ncbi:MAG: LacI family DNA-binding transcriptional regulator [Bacteroidota bacterium]
MIKKVKLSDIATKLNVSVSLVSFVMSGKWKEKRVSPELAKRVMQTAKKMGYQPNSTARALRTGKTGVIGLVVADISNPFYGKIAREIENEASKLGLQLMFASSDENLLKFKKIVDTLIGRQVDGLIVVPVLGSEKFLLQKNKHGVPIVQIDRNFKNTGLPFVIDDGIYGGQKLTELLINRGYSNISTVVFKSKLSNLKERVEGFKRIIKTDNDRHIIEVPVRGYETVLEEKLMDSVKKGVDGFFFTQNRLGIAGLKILKRNNVRIPGDVVIVSYDNPEIFELGSPSISCYQQSIMEMSKASVAIITDIINKGNSEKVHYRIKGQLIERESSKSVK